MSSDTPPVSKKVLWTGRIMTGLVTLFFLFDGGIKLVKPAPVVTAMTKLGFPESSIVVLGIVVILSTIAYAVPRTSVLGAILLTGYLGGAVATNLRGDASLFGQILSPVYCGVLVWGGIFLRDPRVRAVFPIRR